MLIQIVSIVFRIFAVIVVGYLYGRQHRPDMIATNQVNMDVFVPALALAGRSFEFAEVKMIAIGGAVIVLGSGLLGWPIARLMGYAPKTLLPPMMFKNAGNMGLPHLLFAFDDRALPAAVVLFLIENVLHFTIATWWMGHNIRLWRLFREPVFAAAVAGILVSISGITLWPPQMSGAKVIADVSTGLMLFSLGVRLNTAPFAEWRIGLVGAVVTPLTGMLIACLFCLAFGLSSRETDVLLLFGAPAACRSQLHVCGALRTGAAKGRVDRDHGQSCGAGLHLCRIGDLAFRLRSHPSIARPGRAGICTSSPIRRGSFSSIKQLVQRIDHFVTRYNQNCQRFAGQLPLNRSWKCAAHFAHVSKGQHPSM